MISSPYAENFGLKIEGDAGVAAAREIKGINLDPQGEGSDAKYSNLTGGKVKSFTIERNSTGSTRIPFQIGSSAKCVEAF